MDVHQWLCKMNECYGIRIVLYTYFSMLILPLLLWLTRDRWILLAQSAIDRLLDFLPFEVSSIASNVILELETLSTICDHYA